MAAGRDSSVADAGGGSCGQGLSIVTPRHGKEGRGNGNGKGENGD